MSLLAGQILQSRYRILRPLGQGGMGAVYLAEDMRLGNRCALKESVPDPAASPQMLAQLRAQFELEARTLAALSHSNLPKVSDYFPEGGNEYIVMEYVEGEDLASVLARHGGPLPEKPVLIWADQVLDALDYLHSQPNPIIHRDIKPANIILTPQGKVKLVDFGLVKLYDPTNPRTATAMKGMGTPEYTPLEQYAGGAGHTDARSDIYALGATLYHLLTGAIPINAPQRSLNPGSLVAPRQLAPGLSASTEASVLKAMAVHPDQRLQTAPEMRSALAQKPQTPTPTTIVMQPARSRRQWPLAIWVGVPVLVFLMLLVVWPGRGDAPPPATPMPTRLALVPITTAPTAAVHPAPTIAPPTKVPEPTEAPEPAKAPALGIGSTTVSDKDGMILVYVPAGEFTMGSVYSDNDAEDNEKPQHKVTLNAYWIDRTEVTNAMFARFVAASGRRTDAEKAGKAWAFNATTKQWEEKTGADWQHPRGADSDLAGLEQHPVVQVSWNDATAYCAWAGRRLPTEAEWEKAARGTDGRKFPWGNQNVASDLLNFADRNLDVDWADRNVNDGYQFTAPVGSYPRGVSPHGALDMAGNVWEWVGDWYDERYYASAPAQNPQGLDTGQYRALRGGSWLNVPGGARAAYRFKYAPDRVFYYVGFRCARSQ